MLIDNVIVMKVSMRLDDSGQSEKNEPFPLQNQMDVVNASMPVCGAVVSEGLTSQMKHLSQSSGPKLGFTSFSIYKPDPKTAVFPDNGAEFTFPVSASSGAFTIPFHYTILIG
ncbi:hypothetical protein NE237_026163 [Protea cynaroides]|uniref:Uncharacterized protein n=1 Tax=Protea cynaroides TaxID=273540 RepID=A0A9Q0H7M4_9MAGN|nr:hypothetical protein NE237_026163 [Protea cynaroides]